MEEQKWIELSQRVKDICKKYYATQCGTCPLRPACVKKNVHTRKQLNQNTLEINSLAEEIYL